MAIHLMTVITTTSAALKCSSKHVLHTKGFVVEASLGCLSNVKKLVVIVITAMMISHGCVAHHSPYSPNNLDIFNIIVLPLGRKIKFVF